MTRRSLAASFTQQAGIHLRKCSGNYHCLAAKPRLHISHCISCPAVNRQKSSFCSSLYSRKLWSHSRCQNFIPSTPGSISRLFSTRESGQLPWKEILPFGSVRVNLTEALAQGWRCGSVEELAEMLKNHVSEWRAEQRSAVWLHIPVSLGALIPLANEQGFTLHHARVGEIVMSQWLLENKVNKLPRYASHQVGVCGVVLREDTNEVLVTQDKYKPPMWKFPGGLSEFAEDIADAAVREVKEETGVDTEFMSILAFRQQHNIPRYFNISDLYYICSLRPLNFELRPCQDEIVKCQWMNVEELAVSEEATPLSNRIAKLLIQGDERGLPSIGMGMEQLWYSYEGTKICYKLFIEKITSN